MSEMDRAPLIRVQVDQEVFVDSVREGDEIEDATVATEVTSFDRVGDAFVLEGAIVFAGYAKRVQANTDFESNEAPRSNLDFSEGAVQHLHHRMPFFLRVPVKSQPRGLVNVASRIAQWNLKVIEAGWVHVTADLNIVGLNGQEGYHFQCGAQEVGDILFGVPDASFEDSSKSASASPEGSSATSLDAFHESYASLMRSSDEPQGEENDPEQDETRGEVKDDSTVLKAAEKLSEARGGQRPDNDESTVTEQLADFDRVFDGSETPAGGSEETASNAPPAHSPYADSAEGSDEPTWAEFEFEHQLSTADEASQNTNPLHKDEQFVPSRSFSVEGFHAASGFVPSDATDAAKTEEAEGAAEARSVQQVGQSDAVIAESPLRTADVTGDESELTEIQDENRGDGVLQTDSLWSFVDFNAPERAHTLRFVVVQEEETLALVAERVACSKTDLIRVNELRQETVEAGQLLMVPAQNKTVAH